MPATTIKFYHQAAPYGQFSNFYMRAILIQNVLTGETTRWPSTEHFFQGMKSLDPDTIEHVRTKLDTPGKAKNYCTNVVKLRPDWEHSVEIPLATADLYRDEQGLVVDKTKDHFMYAGLIAKFTQHADLAKILLETETAQLVEDTQSVGSDPYWGNGPSGTGLNKLGRMLMLIRKSLPRHLKS